MVASRNVHTFAFLGPEFLYFEPTFTKHSVCKREISVLESIMTRHFISFRHVTDSQWKYLWCAYVKQLNTQRNVRHQTGWKYYLHSIDWKWVRVCALSSKVHHRLIKVSQAILFNFRTLSISIPWLLQIGICSKQHRDSSVRAAAVAAAAASPFRFA